MFKPGQGTGDNMAHVHCMLDTYGYKHTLIIYDTYYCLVTLVTLYVNTFQVIRSMKPFTGISLNVLKTQIDLRYL